MAFNKSVSALVSVALLNLVLVSAWSTPATSRLLGVTHRLIASGATLTVELTIRPKRDFGRVAVEAGSGVKSITPPCRFDSVSANTPYVCRLEITGTPTDGYLTLNVVGVSEPVQGALEQTEVQHLTFRNGAFQKAVPAASSHRLAPAASH